MKPFEHYSPMALKAELDNINKMKFLVNNMKKPDNFTYVDVKNLHDYLENLYEVVFNELQSKL